MDDPAYKSIKMKNHKLPVRKAAEKIYDGKIYEKKKIYDGIPIWYMFPTPHVNFVVINRCLFTAIYFCKVSFKCCSFWSLGILFSEHLSSNRTRT